MEPDSWQNLLDELTSKVNNDKTFKKSNQLKEREVGMFCTNEYYSTRLSKWITHCLSHGTHHKSESKSSICRNKGNNKYKVHNDVGSLELYTESVRYAPRGSSDLALAYANRSAVLLHLEYYQECLRDIELALKNNYPQHLRHKLEARQGQCLAEIQLHKTEMSQKDIKYVTICSQKEVSTHLHEACSTNTSSRDCEDNLSKQEHYVELPSVVHGESDKFPFASSSLDLVYDKFKGRHVKTNKDIRIKEILFVEKPFAFVVLPDHYNIHCHHCCTAFIAPIPCWECSDALYCSEVCRQESWEDYHQWECHGGLQLFHSVGIAHLGLRVVLRAGNLRSLHQKWNKLKDDVDGTELRDKDNRYRSVYNLVSHLGDMERGDYLQYALTAALLTVYLRDHTDYFKEATNTQSPRTGPTENNIQLRDALFFVGNLLHRHVAQLVCNGHAITKLHTAPGTHSSRVVTECQVRVATAIYPSASMMNHSCDPNIINSFHNQYLIVRACKDIPKGHEVYNCYGPHFRRMPLQERQDILREQYFFVCRCEPCSKPSRFDFLKRFEGLLCPTCDGPLVNPLTNISEDGHTLLCLDCGNVQESSNLIKLSLQANGAFKTGCELVERGDITGGLEKLLVCWKVHRQCTYKYSKDMTNCLDQTAKCYAMLGHFSKSVLCLELCLPAVEEQFGPNSIELANELQKVTDVMICELQQIPPHSHKFITNYSRACVCLQRAKDIMELCYGIWNQGVQDIVKKQHQLEQLFQQK